MHMSQADGQATRRVVHPQLGPGELRQTFMGGFEWEVAFDSGRRFRLPAREFEAESRDAWQAAGRRLRRRRARLCWRPTSSARARRWKRCGWGSCRCRMSRR